MIGMRAKGFTLVEVLAAVVFMAIVIPVAMHGVSLATSVAGSARRNAEAAELAQSKMSELQVTRGWQTGNLSGDFGEDHAEYRWMAELAPWEVGTLQQLHVHVLWNAAGREQQVTVTTLVDTEAN
jgi:prepilin-type N-terminal cleavage/methylation domain-containing protein